VVYGTCQHEMAASSKGSCVCSQVIKAKESNT